MKSNGDIVSNIDYGIKFSYGRTSPVTNGAGSVWLINAYGNIWMFGTGGSLYVDGSYGI